VVDWLRRDFERWRPKHSYFYLKDGSKYYYPVPDHKVGAMLFTYAMQCARADYGREPRPEPLEIHRKMCEARDREAVVRKLVPAWRPDAIQHPSFPFNCWVLVEEGRLEHLNMAGDPSVEPIRPEAT
jgi:hypothetical protein